MDSRCGRGRRSLGGHNRGKLWIPEMEEDDARSEATTEENYGFQRWKMSTLARRPQPRKTIQAFLEFVTWYTFDGIMFVCDLADKERDREWIHREVASLHQWLVIMGVLLVLKRAISTLLVEKYGVSNLSTDLKLST